MTLPPRALVGLLALVMVLLMALLGAQVKVEYIREVLRRPRALVVGLAGQLFWSSRRESPIHHAACAWSTPISMWLKYGANNCS